MDNIIIYIVLLYDHESTNKNKIIVKALRAEERLTDTEKTFTVR